MSDASVVFSSILTRSGHRFGRATLNAPSSLNALSLEMVDLLTPQIDAWATDPEVAGIVLEGSGEQAFCAGGDVVGLGRELRRVPPGVVPELAKSFFEREYRLDHKLHRYPKPVLCWGNGIVMGGGVGLMVGASHRVVTPKTRLAMPEITIGLYPDVGGSWVLPQLPGRSGLFLALTGASLNAADSLYAGLADVALPTEGRDRLYARIGDSEWTGERGTDDVLLSQLLESLGAGLDLAPSPLRAHEGLIIRLIEDDPLPVIAPRLLALASHEERWLAQAGRGFAAGSPTSAALGMEMQRRACSLDLAETFRLEYQASIGCCAHTDFAEGVRALLIDKDKLPRWQPATIGELSSEWIAEHLSPRHEGPHPLADLK